MNMKGDSRTRMVNLPLSQKKALLLQDKQMRMGSTRIRPTARNQTYSPSSGTGIIPRLVPQLTGDSLMKRLSISGWGGAVTHVEQPAATGLDSIPDAKVHPEEMQPLQPQSTGSLWSGWWSSTSYGNTQEEKTPKEYLDLLRVGKTKYLLQLRVHLSTAKILWIHEFIENEKGMDVLGSMLANLVAKGGKRRVLTEAETMNLLDIIKCFRILLNITVSFSLQRCICSLYRFSLDSRKLCKLPYGSHILHTPSIHRLPRSVCRSPKYSPRYAPSRSHRV